jgi:hypothetical protein
VEATALEDRIIALIVVQARRNRVRTGKPSCVSVWTDTTLIQDCAQGKCFVLGCRDKMRRRKGLKLTPKSNPSPSHTSRPDAAAPRGPPAVLPSRILKRRTEVLQTHRKAHLLHASQTREV